MRTRRGLGNSDLLLVKLLHQILNLAFPNKEYCICKSGSKCLDQCQVLGGIGQTSTSIFSKKACPSRPYLSVAFIVP